MSCTIPLEFDRYLFLGEAEVDFPLPSRIFRMGSWNTHGVVEDYRITGMLLP